MATFYVDPSAEFNGNGTAGNQATTGGGVGAYNTWVGVTLTANNIYLQRRGTTYIGASVRPISQNSAVTTPLTISSYFLDNGADDSTKPLPIVNHNGGTNGVGAIFIDTCSNVLVQNMHGTNSGGSLGGGVTTRRSQNVTFKNCIGSASEHGCCIVQDQASGTSVTNNISVIGGSYFNNVSLGVCLRWGTVSTAVLNNITIDRISAYNNGTGKTIGANATSVPAGGIGSYTQSKASIGTVGFQSFNMICTNNYIYNNNGYGINIEGFASNGSYQKCTNNIVTGNGASLDVDSHSLWLGNSSQFVVENNLVYGNFANANATTGSGVGIFIDWNASSTAGGSDNIVRKNKIYNQYVGSTLAAILAAGAGIIVLQNTNTVVESNLIYNCRNGISIGNGPTDVCVVRGNTISNTLDSGINVLPQGTNVLVQNNIIQNTNIGLFVNSTSTAGYAENYNSVTVCVTPKANGTATVPTPTTLDVTDITLANKLNSDFYPQATSPLIGAGLLSTNKQDVAGHQRKINPTIGAYEYNRPREVASTRNVRA